MCGFIGQVSFKTIDTEILDKPNQRIVCRGPDSCNKRSFEKEGLKLHIIFNRLRILDLTTKADQPMFSNGNRSVIMFNGEIYNHFELRKKLESDGVKFLTNNSDTETILNGLDKHGKEFVKRLRGQFSFFYIDFKLKKIILCRDRLGQKPLFYKVDEEVLTFSSNLKSLIETTKCNSINMDELVNYLNLGVVPSPNTIFDNIYKVKPSELLEFSYINNKFEFIKEDYWSIEKHINNKQFKKEEFFSLFSESVSIRHKADVPVTNFLSGGIDSTSIIKNLHDNGISTNTFSVEFPGTKYDESYWSRLAAKKYDTQHQSIELDVSMSFENVLDSLNSLDEPYSDPSVLPSNLISKQISKSFKVALSGDGGDELLGGYKRINKTLKSKSLINELFSKFYNFYPPYFGSGNLFLSESKNIERRYRSYLEDIKFLKMLEIELDKHNLYGISLKTTNNFYKSILMKEYDLFLSEMMLLKIDRTSMNNSLEVRSPFLDHKLIEFVFAHETNYIKYENPKEILKNYLLEDFNSDFVNRSKQGFVFDIESWISKNEMIIKEYLFEGKLKTLIDMKNINKLFIFRSRTNNLRIWKLIVLNHFLLDVL